MLQLVEKNQEEVKRLCKLYGVSRLELFGSAIKGDFNEKSSDLDFLVEFQEMPPAAYVEAYFGLLESLNYLFKHPVDLVSISAIKNPYFLRGIEKSRALLYAA